MFVKLASFRSRCATCSLPALAALAAALLAAPVTATASTVFNITGVGCVSNYVLQQDGLISSGCFGAIDQGFSMTGTVTLDVNGVPDGSNTNPASAYGNNWVTASYQIQWTGPTSPTSGTYDGQLSGVSAFQNTAEVYNEIGYGQELFTSRLGEVVDGLNQASTFAYLLRLTDPMNGSWLSDLSFVETAGLAPGPNATNWLFFSLLSVTKDPVTGENRAVLPGSLSGTFVVTSMTAAAVPEPGTGALALAGVAIFGLVRRRRSSNRL
jgi:MYXO-CTERM domain-containing protein